MNNNTSSPEVISIFGQKWGSDEHARLMEGLGEYGTNRWDLVTQKVGTRTMQEVISYGTNFLRHFGNDSDDEDDEEGSIPFSDGETGGNTFLKMTTSTNSVEGRPGVLFISESTESGISTTSSTSSDGLHSVPSEPATRPLSKVNKGDSAMELDPSVSPESSIDPQLVQPSRFPISINAVQQTADKDGLVISTPEWSIEEEQMFENGLHIYMDMKESSRWEAISGFLNGSKTAEQIKKKYQQLVKDVNSILMGEQTLPKYKQSHFVIDWEGQRPADLISARTARRRAQKKQSSKGKSWTEEEHRAFLRGLKIYGRGEWKKISQYCVPSRTSVQVASHAQKYFIRQNKAKNSSSKKRASIHDITDPEQKSPFSKGGKSTGSKSTDSGVQITLGNDETMQEDQKPKKKKTKSKTKKTKKITKTNSNDSGSDSPAQLGYDSPVGGRQRASSISSDASADETVNGSVVQEVGARARSSSNPTPYMRERSNSDPKRILRKKKRKDGDKLVLTRRERSSSLSSKKPPVIQGLDVEVKTVKKRQTISGTNVTPGQLAFPVHKVKEMDE
eukprot:TRINITY_DN430_c0_g1_i3.p1 TRINITY_DN430_c0_g1~~TRINITY_DN430_c0_g1_i3.p1  ORF type:complete len:571 (+),score=189.56 TRINITY_DN430_c0_g1_i3:32-1714(+)